MPEIDSSFYASIGYKTTPYDNTTLSGAEDLDDDVDDDDDSDDDDLDTTEEGTVHVNYPHDLGDDERARAQ